MRKYNVRRFYKAFRLIVELINKMQDKEKADEVFEMCIKYLLNVRDDIEIEELERTANEESVERGELIMSIAEKLREEGIEKGIEKHPEWFLKDEKGNFTRKVSEWNDVYDLDFNNKELWEYLISVLEMWVELGVDGFRCDVASLIPLDFWRRAKEYISQKKELIWLAESLDLNFLNSLRNRGFEVSCDAELYDVFDLTYDYDGYEYLHSFFRGEKGLDYFLNQIYLQKTMLPNNSVKMRFLENHDNPRISFLLNGKNKIKNWTMFYSLLPGATLVYAGQELMLDKLPSLFDKDPIKWNKGDYEFLNYFKKVIKLSKEIKSQCDLFSARELAKGIIELKWKGESSEYLAILNLEDRFGEIPVDFTLYASDLLTNEIVKIEKIFKIRKLPLIFKLK
jgi:cyclomaltodextrinase